MMNFKDEVKKVNWVQEIFKKGLFSLFALIPLLFPQFQSNIINYNISVFLIFYFIILLNLLYDIFYHRPKISQTIIIHSISFLLSFSLVIVIPKELVKYYFPVFFQLIFLIFFKISQILALQYKYFVNNKIKRNIGFAVTGIIIKKSTNISTILVYNKNLREGKGLWVPPGGHFFPQTEDPVEKLRAKILQEIGYNIHIISSPNMINSDPSYNTELTKWFTPPVFLLEENLMGYCSNNHNIHIDFVYMCETDGHISSPNCKYKDSHIEVPLEKCSNSVNDAESTVYETIDNWCKNMHIKFDGSRDSVTRDVIIRLHLAAKYFLKK